MFKSIHGRQFGYDEAFLYLHGNPIGPGGLPFSRGGRTLFVDSNVDGASGKNPDEAMGTLQEAIDQFDTDTQDNLDPTIVVMPNHAETITGVGGLTFDVAGLRVIGLGRYNQRPRFLMDGAATVTAAVTGADTLIQNLVFASGHADVATCFDLDAKGFNLIDCEFGDNTAAENFLAIVTSGSTTDNVCDGLSLIGNYWYSPDAACTHLLAQTGDVDGLFVRGNVVVIPASTAGELVDVTSGDDMQGVVIDYNYLQHAMTAGELFVSNDQSDNSGIIAHNRIRHADVTTTHDLGIDGLGCGLFDNLSASTDSVSGFVLPAIDANS